MDVDDYLCRSCNSYLAVLILRKIGFIFFLLFINQVLAVYSVVDDSGQKIVLNHAATRIVSLSPHITEILFYLGVGNLIVGRDSASDYPPAAKKISVVGNYADINLEKIIQLQPDLIIAWHGGSPLTQLKKLQQLGFNVFYSAPKTLNGIASDIEKIGRLVGKEKVGQKYKHKFDQQLLTLRQKYQHLSEVRVFFQIWSKPLMTVGNNHIISQMISLCGGKNIFSDITIAAAKVSLESVIKRDPHAIIASPELGNWQQTWEKWPIIYAVKYHHLYNIPADLTERPGPRIILGIKMLCRDINHTRSMRLQNNN